MHKNLHWYSGSLARSTYLFEGELSRQHQLREARAGKALRLFGRADVALRARVQSYRGQFHLEIGHILHNQRIHAGLVELPHHSLDLLQLLVEHYGIHSHIYPCPEAVGEVGESRNIGYRVSCGGAGTESGRAYIYGISTRKNGRAPHRGVACRSKKFKRAHVQERKVYSEPRRARLRYGRDNERRCSPIW